MVKITADHPDDVNLLHGLYQSDSKAVQQVYDLAQLSVITWVKENSGTETDGRDIFQEGMLALFQRLQQGDFHLSCRLKSYLRIICRNLWMTRLRNQQKTQYTDLQEAEEILLEPAVHQLVEQSEEQQLFFGHFDLLGEKCRKILQWFFDRMPLKTIAGRLDTTEAYIKKKKFNCKQQLVKAIQSDPKFEELRQQ